MKKTVLDKNNLHNPFLKLSDKHSFVECKGCHNLNIYVECKGYHNLNINRRFQELKANSTVENIYEKINVNLFSCVVRCVNAKQKKMFL